MYNKIPHTVVVCPNGSCLHSSVPAHQRETEFDLISSQYVDLSDFSPTTVAWKYVDLMSFSRLVLFGFLSLLLGCPAPKEPTDVDVVDDNLCANYI